MYNKECVRINAHIDLERLDGKFIGRKCCTNTRALILCKGTKGLSKICNWGSMDEVENEVWQLKG